MHTALTFHNGVDIVIGKDKNGNRNDGVYMPVDAEIIDFPGGVCGNGIKFKVKFNFIFVPYILKAMQIQILNGL